ncbi:uromodulin-like, partial [Eucyclogobius newberryi]|uniref:uromodulin-like n=1 Tax=Eucyclogobius newberryi TaxID=166745 RepID=UPI003B5CC136
CSFCSVVAGHMLNFAKEPPTQLDACRYSLISSAPIPGLQVLGVLKTHAHLNVTFLDKVTLIYGNISIALRGGEARGPGGDISLELKSGPVTVAQGLNVTRDQMFTRIDLQHGDFALRLLHNQVSTHIWLIEPKGQRSSVGGLCEGAAKAVDHQDECDVQYEDPRGAAYDSQKDALWSGFTLLRCAVFDAETSTLGQQVASLCRSVVRFTGDAGGRLTCAMSLALNSSYDQQQPSNQPPCDLQELESCLSRVCGESEFCGTTSQNHVGCFCHSSVYAQINETGRVGVLECVVSNATLTIPNCYLSEKGLNYTRLHLTDASCKGQLHPQSQKVVFHSTKDNMCGAMLKTHTGSMMYKNTVVVEPSLEGVADMSCPFAIPEISVDFDMAVTVVEDPSAPGGGAVEYTSAALGNYSVLFAAFLDKDHTRPIDTHTRIKLDTPVYFRIQTHGLEALNPALVLDSCWATSAQNPAHSQKYYLIQKRCPSDPWVALVSSGVNTDAEFMFRMFQFVGKTSDISLHCDLKLCMPEGGGACVPK